MKFKDAKVGDKVYSLRHGWGKVTQISEKELIATFNDSAYNIDYLLDGRLVPEDYTPDLYWNKPTISDDPPPKRKKKVLLRQAILLFTDGGVSVTRKLYRSESDAVNDHALAEFLKWGGESIEVEADE